MAENPQQGKKEGEEEEDLAERNVDEPQRKKSAASEKSSSKVAPEDGNQLSSGAKSEGRSKTSQVGESRKSDPPKKADEEEPRKGSDTKKSSSKIATPSAESLPPPNKAASPLSGQSKPGKVEEEPESKAPKKKDVSPAHDETKEADAAPPPKSQISKYSAVGQKAPTQPSDKSAKGSAPGHRSQPLANRLFEGRSPFIHDPPHPEERRNRINQPRAIKDYIINLREDLADFQEAHGLPRTRDYSFISLGLALAQETGRAIYSIALMLAELFPVIPIVSLILRFALDKVIEILETEGTLAKIKKLVLFFLQITIIILPLWILIATIVIPIFYIMLSLARKIFRFSGGKTGKAKPGARTSIRSEPKGKSKKMCCF